MITQSTSITSKFHLITTYLRSTKLISHSNEYFNSCEDLDIAKLSCHFLLLWALSYLLMVCIILGASISATSTLNIKDLAFGLTTRPRLHVFHLVPLSQEQTWPCMHNVIVAIVLLQVISPKLMTCIQYPHCDMIKSLTADVAWVLNGKR